MGVFRNFSREVYSAIEDGGIYKAMFLRRTYPRAYENKLLEKELADRKIAENLGVEAIPASRSHKAGGVSWEYALLQKMDKDSGEFEDLLIDDKVALPDFNIFGTYDQHIPKYIYDNNMGFKHIIKGGIAKTYQGTDNVIIVQNMPSTLPAKDFDTGMTADQIKDTEAAEAYPELWRQEKVRIHEWNRLMNQWIRISEERALLKLEELISSRLLLCRQDLKPDKIEYTAPEPGLCFTIKIQKTGSFIDLIAFEFNRDKGIYEYFSDGVSEVTDEDRKLASEILALRDRSIEVEEIPHEEAPAF